MSSESVTISPERDPYRESQYDDVAATRVFGR
jgi:hypothetical protein